MIEAKRHVGLDFSGEAFAVLQRMKTQTNAKDNAEVLRNALRLYDWFLQQQAAGRVLQLVNGDSVKELKFKF